MNIQPLDDRVLIECIETKDTTDGGIILPDVAQSRPVRGVVKAVGPGRWLEHGIRTEMVVAVGCEVLLSSDAYSRTKVEAEGPKYVLVAERDILAIVDGVSKTCSGGV